MSLIVKCLTAAPLHYPRFVTLAIKWWNASWRLTTTKWWHLNLIWMEKNLVHKTRINPILLLTFLCLTRNQKFLHFLLCSPEEKKKRKEKSGSWCTLEQINKCGAQWPRCWDHPWSKQSALPPPPLTAVSAWLYYPSSNGFFRHEKQSMTCAQQWQADDEPAPFDDGLCRHGLFFDVEEYEGSVIHYGCTGGPRPNESQFVQC